jgi:hypothetical protein
LKCDREQPCWQCVNSKRERVGPEGCVYEERPVFEVKRARTFLVKENGPSGSNNHNRIQNIHANPSVEASEGSGRSSTHFVRDERRPGINNYYNVHANPEPNNATDGTTSAERSLQMPAESSTEAVRDKVVPRRQYHGINNTRSLIALVSGL